MYKLKKDLINSNRKLKVVTVEKYLNSFKKINDQLGSGQFQSFTFLKNYNKVSSYLNSLNDSQKFNQLKTIVVVLQVNKGIVRKGYKKIIKKYQKDLCKFRQLQNEIRDSGEKTDREEQNWIDWTQITDHVDKLYKKFYDKYYDKDGKLNKELYEYGFDDLNEVQLLFILSMYTQIPPRRLEYSYCKYILYNQFELLSNQEKDDNIFLVTIDQDNNFISFGKNKIKNKTKDNLQVEFNDRLNTIAFIYININHFLRGQNGDNSLLYNSQKKQMSSTSLCIYLSKHFKKIFDKQVSISMLRKIYHTHHSLKIKEAIKEFDKTTKIMNHSKNTAFIYYCKSKSVD
jgi:hypothetical protein